MGLYIVDKDGKFDHWEWEGSVKGLVDAVGDGDARLGFVVDKKSGASISMNISDVDEDNPELGPPTYEPFYVLARDGENMYDAYNRKEAVEMLNTARKEAREQRGTRGRSSKRRRGRTATRGLRGVRR